MSRGPRVLAVDLGATSIRVAAVDLGAVSPRVEVVHRWHHDPIAGEEGSLRWDWPRIESEVERGLHRGTAAGDVASIGVDGWGVDYALLDSAGELVELPYSYRDARTEQWRAIAQSIGFERLYSITGIQLMGINTIFQLAAHERDPLAQARRILLLPDLLVHSLVGWEGSERSNASTTGLVDARTGDWSGELIEAAGVEPSLFPPVQAAGARAGTWHDHLPVHVVGSHDTASAFLGMPGGGRAGTVFVSTGSWVIVGVERPEADTSAAAMRANFSNEAGAFGGVRFLKNVMGFWLIERCRSGWGDPTLDVLLAEAGELDQSVGTFDALDQRYLTSTDVEKEIRETVGLPDEAPRAVIVRTILESIAAGIGAVVREIEAVADLEPSQIALVGGGARQELFHSLIERHTGLPVVVGSSEATALGNAVAQGIALGHFPDLAAARRWVDGSASQGPWASRRRGR